MTPNIDSESERELPSPPAQRYERWLPVTDQTPSAQVPDQPNAVTVGAQTYVLRKFQTSDGHDWLRTRDGTGHKAANAEVNSLVDEIVRLRADERAAAEAVQVELRAALFDKRKDDDWLQSIILDAASARRSGAMDWLSVQRLTERAPELAFMVEKARAVLAPKPSDTPEGQAARSRPADAG